jgi:hypothetical protein
MLNPDLLKLARAMVTKQADGGQIQPITPIQPPPQPQGDPAQAQQGQPAPQQPGAMPGMDPMTAMMGSPQPQAAPAAAGPPKLKPEQMMQMIDMRMYNMQQQLTAIARAVNAQIDMGVLVLPPGTQGAPPAESAIPGGPMDPATQPGAQMQPQGAGPAPGGAPPGGAPPADPAAAAAAGGAPKQAAANPVELIVDGKAVVLEGMPKVAETPPSSTRIISAAVSQLIRGHNARTAA